MEPPSVPVRRIEPSRGWRLDWRELVAYRDLLLFLVRRDLTVQYKQTVLGLGWVVVRPVLTVAIFTVVFGRLAGVPSDGVPYPAFALAALLPWTYLADTVTGAVQGLVAHADTLGKVYFPRLLVPATPAVTKLVDLGLGSLLLVALLAWYGLPPGPGVAVLPLLLAILVATAAGAAFWLSSLSVLYRDVTHATPFVVQLAMFAAPVVWPASLITEHFGPGARWVYGLYPAAGVIEGFRSALLGTVPMPWDLILPGAATALLLLASGALWFRRTERTFADVA